MHPDRGSHVIDSSAVRRRVDQFIGQLADELPGLIAIRYDTAHHTRIPSARLKIAPEQKRLLSSLGQPLLEGQEEKDWPAWGWSFYHTSSLTAVSWLDSLRALWPTLSPNARVQELVGGEGELVTPALRDMAAHRMSLSAIRRYAQTVLDQSQRGARYTEDGDNMAIFAHLLLGSVALAANDTSHAVSEFLSSVRVQRRSTAIPLGFGMPAARALTAIAEAQHDTTLLLTALTFQRLYHAPMWVYQFHIHSKPYADAGALLVNARLEELYTAWVASGRVPPDIIPHRLDGEPVTTSALSYDAYLDHQWTALYDRDFTVARASSSGRRRPHRAVVIEYGTSIDCGACFDEDRLVGAIGRRYSPDEVIPLALHGEGPIAGYHQEWGQESISWYPSFGSGPSRTVIPRRILITAQGDSLDQLYRVNGLGIVRADDRPTDPPQWGTYQRLVSRIDTLLAQRPDARLDVALTVHDDRIDVRTRIDSVHGAHSRLALRLVLLQDTVWIRSGSYRRIYQNVARAYNHADGYPMGVPFTAAEQTELHYTFDVAAVQNDILAARDVDARLALNPMEWDRARMSAERDAVIARFQDPRDWLVDRAHLYVVAFVQDLESGEVLQAVRVKVPPMANPACFHGSAIFTRCMGREPVVAQGGEGLRGVH